jgi:hypothetical protein
MAAGTNEVESTKTIQIKNNKQWFYGRAGAKVHNANNTID